MKRNWIVMTLEIAVIATIVIVGFGHAVLGLWNWLMPSIFGLRRITFLQAVGLLSLCWILLGRGFLGRPGYRAHWRRSIKERWDEMTPEQRESFRKGLQGRCGQFEPSSSADTKVRQGN
jgi:hypothetical protein